MKVVSLLENTTNRKDMLIEHGLSLYIETNGKHILFDMGQSDLFARNAVKLGVDLTKVDFAVLSHGHYDHGGGMETFFKINHTAKVYVSKYAFAPHFNGKNKYIGLDYGFFKNYKDRIVFTDNENKISDNIKILNCNNNQFVYKLNPYGLKKGAPKSEFSSNPCNLDKYPVFSIPGENPIICYSSSSTIDEWELFPDDFRHEQYMMVKEGSQSVLFSGCSHKGILNIMSWNNPDVLIGGFHFKSIPMEGDELEESKKTLADAAKILKTYKAKYYTCHCTGVPQYEYLKTLMGEQLSYLGTGDSLNI